MKKYILLFSVIIASFAITGCNDDIEPGGTATQAMAGDWYVTLTDENGEDQLGDLNMLFTYNTAANVPTEMFFDDHTWWKGKVSCDVNTLTFKTSDFVENHLADYGFKVHEGKIILNGGHAKSGRVTDSIYVKFESADNPGLIYIYSGHRRTGFIEDEY